MRAAGPIRARERSTSHAPAVSIASTALRSSATTPSPDFTISLARASTPDASTVQRPASRNRAPSLVSSRSNLGSEDMKGLASILIYLSAGWTQVEPEAGTRAGAPLASPFPARACFAPQAVVSMIPGIDAKFRATRFRRDFLFGSASWRTSWPAGRPDRGKCRVVDGRWRCWRLASPCPSPRVAEAPRPKPSICRRRPRKPTPDDRVVNS